MRARALLLLVGVLVGAGCGTTGSDVDTAGDGSSTTTPPTAEVTTTTEPEAETIASLSEADLERVLPEVDDLPAGFEETTPEDRPDDAKYEPSIGCEPLVEMVGGSTREDRDVPIRAFTMPSGVKVTASAGAPDEERKAAFEDIGDRVEGCDHFHTTTGGTTAEVQVEAGPADIGDESFVAEMELTIDLDGTESTLGLTLVSVLRGDVAYWVQVVDGFDDAANAAVPRDPALARTLVEQIDERVTLLMGD